MYNMSKPEYDIFNYKKRKYTTSSSEDDEEDEDEDESINFNRDEDKYILDDETNLLPDKYDADPIKDYDTNFKPLTKVLLKEHKQEFKKRKREQYESSPEFLQRQIEFEKQNEETRKNREAYVKAMAEFKRINPLATKIEEEKFNFFYKNRYLPEEENNEIWKIVEKRLNEDLTKETAAAAQKKQ